MIERLLSIDDDQSLIYLLKLSQWKLADAIDEYYKWSGKTDIEYKSIWKWKGDDGEWNDYDDATNEIINELKVGKEISFRIFGRKDSYKFIKSTSCSGVQVNETTKGRREAKRVSGIDYKYVWQWKADDRTWKNYDDKIINLIDNLSIDDHIIFNVNNRNDSYKVLRCDEDTAIQQNQRTHKTRDVKRVRIEINANEYPAFWNDKTICNQHVDEQKLYYQQSERILKLQDYTKAYLIDIDMTSSETIKIKDNFHQSLDKDKYEITKIQSIQNKFLMNRYCETKQRLIKLSGQQNLNELYYDINMMIK